MAETVFVTFAPSENGPPFDELEIAATGQVVARGGVAEVPRDVAGRAPKGKPGEDGHDPGEGLLAQVDVWREANATEKRAAQKATEPAAPIEEVDQ